MSERACRNSALELTRVVGCILVVALHVRPSWVTEKGFGNLNFFLWGLVRDGVSLFWLIQGYFLLNGKKYTQVLKRTITKVIIPAVIMMLFNALFAERILQGDILQVKFSDLTEALKNVWVALISWNATLIPCCPHLWYVFAYFQVILWQPILRLLTENTFARRWVMGIAILAMAINDLQAVHHGTLGTIIPVTILSEGAFFVMLGYEVRLYEDKKPSKGWGGVAMFTFANLVRFVLQKIIFYMDGNYDNMYFMNNTSTLIGVVAALGLFMWLSSIQLKNERIGKVCCFMGGNTYYIYLIHWLVVQKLSVGGLSIWLYEMTKEMLAGGIVYMILFTGIVFGISFLISLLIKTISYAAFRGARVCFSRKKCSNN